MPNEGQTNMLSTRGGKQTCYQTKRKCPRRTNVGLDWVSIVPLDWSMDNTQTHTWTCRHACKDAKSKKSQTGGTKQARQAYQHCTKWRKVCIKHTNTTKVYLTSGYIQTSPRSDKWNHTRTSPQWAQSMAKPRSREENIDIKHKSIQANIGTLKGRDLNPLI